MKTKSKTMEGAFRLGAKLAVAAFTAAAAAVAGAMQTRLESERNHEN
jgi:hypothetical protein